MPFAWWELVLILLVLLLVFGAKRLPEMGRSLGKGMREFKESVTGMDENEKESSHPPAELPAAPSEPTRTETDPAEQPQRERVP
jgi:sec-independent protein translocase protein TatA